MTSTKKLTMTTAVFLAMATAAGPASAEDMLGDGGSGGGDFNRFVFSAVGPGEGHGAMAMGGRVWLFVPTFDLNYARGFTDNFDLVLNLSTLGIISIVDLGVRFRPVGDVDSGFSLALKAGGTAGLLFVGTSEGAGTAGMFAATPGLVLSFGGRETQFSLGADVPMFLGGAAAVTGGGESASASGTDFYAMLRPNATIEFRAGETNNMYIQAGALVGLSGSWFFAPILALGAIW